MASWRDDPEVNRMLRHGQDSGWFVGGMMADMELAVAARDRELRQAIEALPTDKWTGDPPYPYRTRSAGALKEDVLSLLGGESHTEETQDG